MQCANPDCRTPAVDLSTGVLRLLELEVPPEERVVRSDGGFPICVVPTRYFWLCPKCSSFLRIKRWTRVGLTFEHKTTGREMDIHESLVIPLEPRRPHNLRPAIRKTA